jgi:putative tryptophan/tyrosine transport system substrate-binding protein
MIRRREFIMLLGGAATWPLAARAQQVPVVGLLSSGSAEAYAPRVRTFRQGLQEAGYFEGRNVAIELRWADGRYERLPALAADLVSRRVAVIATIGGTTAAAAAKAATSTIPIVFQLGADPVETGLVASLGRPGANVTGVTSLGAELAPKQLELLHEIIPGATAAALLVNPTAPIADLVTRSVQTAADKLGLQLHVLHASSETDFGKAFTAIPEKRVGGLVISTDPFFNSRNEQLGALSVRHRVPAIAQYREFVEAGGLACYGGSATDLARLVGVYAGRVLKGEMPADLPVQQSTKAELIINLKAARTLGLNVPLMLLGRADEVIE